MPGLFLHGRRLSSVFELLGTHENDITYSLGWGLAQSPALLGALLAKTVPGAAVTDKVNIALQEHSEDGGYTDIEIHGPDLFVIVEAKRGWQLPGGPQLQKYAERLVKSTAGRRALVAMAECSHAYAEEHLTPIVAGHPVKYLSWKDVARLASVHTTKPAERHLLRELRVYLHRIVSMQNQTSNMVYVVSLGSGIPSDLQLSWTDIVEKRQRYFHPFGKRWPKEPPNYMGFRYKGRLQSIRHVDSWKIVKNLRAELPEVLSKDWASHFLLYTLGPPIIPPNQVQGGSVKWNTKVWAMLDLLLTCQTISEACDLTKRRLAEDQ